MVAGHDYGQVQGLQRETEPQYMCRVALANVLRRWAASGAFYGKRYSGDSEGKQHWSDTCSWGGSRRRCAVLVSSVLTCNRSCVSAAAASRQLAFRLCWIACKLYHTQSVRPMQPQITKRYVRATLRVDSPHPRLIVELVKSSSCQQTGQANGWSPGSRQVTQR
jgi:hypothetical protein